MIFGRTVGRRVSGLLILLLALASCGGGSQTVQPAPVQPGPVQPMPAAGGQISGRVTVPAGADVRGTVVIACVLLPTDLCDEGRTGSVTVTQPGTSAAYTITDLKAGSYLVLALKVTLDAQGEVKSIDYLGGYGSEQTRVTPGSSGIDITLQATATSAPTAPPISGPVPAGKVSAEVVGSWNGRASGTDLYSIGADGSYSRTLIDQAGCYRIERREAGNAVTTGTQVTFYPNSNFSKLLVCGSYSENRDPVPNSTFSYRFETDPINANRYLFLKPQDGPELQYLKE